MRRTRNRHAFTVLELLIAVTLTLALAALMLAVTSTTLRLWRRTQDTFAMDAQAKLVLDWLERDLQGAILRKDGRPWLSAIVANDTADLTARSWTLTSPLARMKPVAGSLRHVRTDGLVDGKIGNARFGIAGTWLRFITTDIDADGSKPVAVSYQICRRPITGDPSVSSNSAEIRYALFREEVDPPTTFSPVLEELFPDGATPAMLQAPGSKDVIATNVVDFGVWFYRSDRFDDSRTLFPTRSRLMEFTAPTDEGPLGSADVMIRVLTDEGASLVAAIETGKTPPVGTDWWWTIVEAHSRVYLRHVELKAAEF